MRSNVRSKSPPPRSISDFKIDLAFFGSPVSEPSLDYPSTIELKCEVITRSRGYTRRFFVAPYVACCGPAAAS